MPTRDPPPDDRVLYCLMCDSVIPEHRDENGKRKAGQPRTYCRLRPGETGRSKCEMVWKALRTLEQDLPDILPNMPPRRRTEVRGTVFAILNTVPQGGFNSPEWQAKAKKAQAEKAAARKAASAGTAGEP